MWRSLFSHKKVRGAFSGKPMKDAIKPEKVKLPAKCIAGLFFLLAVFLFCPGCDEGGGGGKSSATPEPEPPGVNEITSFGFNAADNPLLSEDIEGTINGTSIEIEFPVIVDRSGLVASFETAGETVTVESVPQESGVTANDFTEPVQYTVTGDDGTQAAYTVTATMKLKMTSSVTDYFYYSLDVSADGTTLAVGDFSTGRTGSIYLYEDYYGAMKTTHIVPGSYTDESELERYGEIIAISGNGQVVATRAKGPEVSIDGTTSRRGVVYLYRYEDGSWNETVIAPSQVSADEVNFGVSIDLSCDGNTMVAGANYFNRYTGYQQFVSPYMSGVVFVYKYDGVSWKEYEPDHSALGQLDWFGTSVAISGDGNTLVAGAPVYPFNDAWSYAYVFTYDGVTDSWTQVQELGGSENVIDSHNGGRVAISGDGKTILMRSSNGNFEYGAETSLNTTYMVYIYEYTGSQWEETAILRGSENYYSVNYAYNIKISNDGSRIFIGDIDYGNFDTDDNNYYGCMYVYSRGAGGWTTWSRARVNAYDPATFDYLGNALAVTADGETVFTSSIEKACGSTKGALYMFRMIAGEWVDYL